MNWENWTYLFLWNIGSKQSDQPASGVVNVPYIYCVLPARLETVDFKSPVHEMAFLPTLRTGTLLFRRLCFAVDTTREVMSTQIAVDCAHTAWVDTNDLPITTVKQLCCVPA